MRPASSSALDQTVTALVQAESRNGRAVLGTEREPFLSGAQSPTGEFMKLIRVLIVAALTVSCSRATTSERTDHKSDDTASAAATSRETGQPAATREPPTQP